MSRPGRIVRFVGLGVAALVAALVLLESSLDAMDVLRVGALADFRELHRRSEPAARTADGRPALWRLEPGAPWSAGEASFRIEPDPAGRRGPAVASPKPPGTFRIVALGDGAAFGWGVDDELTALRQLEYRLNEHAPDAVTVEVVNAAHPFQRLDALDAALDAIRELEPDLVLVFDRAHPRGLPDDLRAIRDGDEPPRPWWGRRMPTIWDVLHRPARPGDGGEPIVAAAELATALVAARTSGLRPVLVGLGGRSLPDMPGVPRVEVDLSASAAPVYLAPRAGFPSALGQRRIAEALATGLAGLVPTRGD